MNKTELVEAMAKKAGLSKKDTEAAVNALSEAVAAGESTEGLADQFEAAEKELAVFADYDNVLPELQTRAQAAEAKLQEVIDAMLAE